MMNTEEDIELDTGHPGIDKQHEHLAQMVQNLGALCEQRRKTGQPCVSCKPECLSLCKDRLADLITDLLGFMFEHFVYEEKLMRLLPDTEECANHIDGHTKAHADISQQLSQLTANLDKIDPRQSSMRLQKIISGWLGQHSVRYDCTLSATLVDSYDTEVDYDKELSKLLGTKGQH